MWREKEIFSIRTDGERTAERLDIRLLLRLLCCSATLTAFIAAPMICSLYGRVMLCCKAPDISNGRTDEKGKEKRPSMSGKKEEKYRRRKKRQTGVSAAKDYLMQKDIPLMESTLASSFSSPAPIIFTPPFLIWFMRKSGGSLICGTTSSLAHFPLLSLSHARRSTPHLFDETKLLFSYSMCAEMRALPPPCNSSTPDKGRSAALGGKNHAASE